MSELKIRVNWPRRIADVINNLPKGKVDAETLYLHYETLGFFAVVGVVNTNRVPISDDDDLIRVAKSLDSIKPEVKLHDYRTVLEVEISGQSLVSYPSVIRAVWYGKMIPTLLYVPADAAASVNSPFLASVTYNAMKTIIDRATNPDYIKEVIYAIKHAPAYVSRRYRIDYRSLLPYARRRLRELTRAQVEAGEAVQ